MLDDEYQCLGISLAEALPPLTIRSMYLPPVSKPGTHGDCFGFLFLSDGSAGAFYISLGDAHQRFVSRYPVGNLPQGSVPALLHGFTSNDALARALALGAFNALSQSLLRRTGFKPSDAPVSAEPPDGETIGMVGYFGRLARRWSERGIRVKVLELAPRRVAPLPGVSLVRDASELRECNRIICTSSVLVNQTLDALLDAIGDASAVELTGPSGSGLPDIPLSRGIRSVGGTFFADSETLLSELDHCGRWGASGQRFELQQGNYPGFEFLLKSLPDGTESN